MITSAKQQWYNNTSSMSITIFSVHTKSNGNKTVVDSYFI